jgi:hypothetical protein
MYRPIDAEIRTLNQIGCSRGRKIQDFQRDPMGIPTRSPAMKMGKRRLYGESIYEWNTRTGREREG